MRHLCHNFFQKLLIYNNKNLSLYHGTHTAVFYSYFNPLNHYAESQRPILIIFKISEHHVHQLFLGALLSLQFLGPLPSHECRDDHQHGFGVFTERAVWIFPTVNNNKYVLICGSPHYSVGCQGALRSRFRMVTFSRDYEP